MIYTGKSTRCFYPLIILAGGFFVLFPSFNVYSSDKPMISLFGDTGFSQGFSLQFTDSAKGRAVEKSISGMDKKALPIWRICQWASKYSLAETTEVYSASGEITLENQGKKVVFGGNPPGNLIMAVYGKAEYGSRARKSGEGWPHLLIEQDASALYPLHQLQSIDFLADARLLLFTDGMGKSADPGLHAAQFQLFLIIKNIDPSSKNYNDFFWFGVPFFDNRYDIPPEYKAKDVGKNDATGKFIYTISGNSVQSIPMIRGEWISIKTNLLPAILRGLEDAVQLHYLTDANPEHYAAVNMNMGWEVPGIYDVSMQIRNFNIAVQRK